MKHWNDEPDENNMIDVPDELMPLMNKLGMQLRFHTISDKGETLTIIHMVRIAQKFFTEHPELLLEPVEN